MLRRVKLNSEIPYLEACKLNSMGGIYDKNVLRRTKFYANSTFDCLLTKSTRQVFNGHCLIKHCRCSSDILN